MAIPNRPLNFRAADMTIDDFIWLNEAMSGDMAPDILERLKEILSSASDWTLGELGKVRIGELSDVMAKMKGDSAEPAVPLSTGGNSTAGPTEPAPASPAG